MYFISGVNCRHSLGLPVKCRQTIGDGKNSAGAERKSKTDLPNQYSGPSRYSGRHQQNVVSAAPAELIAIPPRRELGTLWLSNPHELEPFLYPGEANLVGAYPKTSDLECALTLFQRLPSFLDGCEVPLFA